MDPACTSTFGVVTSKVNDVSIKDLYYNLKFIKATNK